MDKRVIPIKGDPDKEYFIIGGRRNRRTKKEHYTPIDTKFEDYYELTSFKINTGNSKLKIFNISNLDVF